MIKYRGTATGPAIHWIPTVSPIVIPKQAAATEQAKRVVVVVFIVLFFVEVYRNAQFPKNEKLCVPANQTINFIKVL